MVSPNRLMSIHPFPKHSNRQNKQRFPASHWTTPRSLVTAIAAFPGLAFAALTLLSTGPVEGAVIASAPGGNLTGILTTNGDTSVLSTTTSGADIQVVGSGFTTTSFPNVSNLSVLFGAANQTVTFDSGAFSFPSGVTISSSRGGANDAVVKAGANTLTITGTSNYLGGTTISAGTLQIGNGGKMGSIVGNVIDNASLVFDRSNSLTFAGNITGSGSLTKNGAGTLTLTGGGSNYAGGTAINTGVLAFNRASALGTGSIALGIGTELRSIATATLMNAVSFAEGGTSVISAGAGTTLTLGSIQAGNFNPARAIFGSAGNTGVVVIGPETGSYSVNSASTIDVAYGTLRNGGAGGLGLGTFTANVASTTVEPGATLDLNDNSLTVANLAGLGTVTLGINANTAVTANSGDFGGAITGAGQLNKTTTGGLYLYGTNTYTGGTTISAGTLQVGIGGTTGSLAGNVIDNAALVFDRSNAVTFGGNITGSGSLTKNGAGTLSLTGAGSSFSGGTTINGGVVSVNHSNSLGTGTVTLNNGSGLLATTTLTLANPVILGSGPTDSVSAAAGATLTLTALQINGGTNAVFGSPGNTGTVVLGPLAGMPLLSSAPAIEVAFGTLRNGAEGSGGLGFFTATFSATSVDTGAILDVHDFHMEVANLQGAGAVTLGANAATVLDVDAGNFRGAISGAGQLNKVSGGTLVLAGTNTYTGGTTINVGTLQVGNGGTTGSIAGNVIDNAALVFNRTDALTFAGDITGSGTITKNGAGTLTLTGTASNYAGGTSINGGILAFGHASSVGTGPITLGAGTELRSTATATLTNAVAFAEGSNSAVSAAAGTTLTLGTLRIGALNPANAVFGSAGNTGTVIIGPATSGYAFSPGSSIEVAFGTLRNGAFGDLGLAHFTGNLLTTVDSGATLDVNDKSLTLANLQGAGSVTLGGSAATVATVNAGVFSGVISGSGQINKQTSDTLVLAGANLYTGGTTIGGGTVQIGYGGTTGSIAGNVIDYANLAFDRSNAVTFAGTISGTGILSQLGTGALTLTSVNTYSGGTMINAGTVSISNPGALGSGNVTLNNGGGLLATSNLTLANAVLINAGETGIISAAPGTTLTLNAINSLGNVVFGSAGHTGVIAFGPFGPGFNSSKTSTIEVAAGTLRNTNNILNTLAQNAASLTIDSGATLDVNDNTMFLGNLLGTGSVTLGSNPTTDLIISAGSFGGGISGAGQVTKFGLGTLVLTGANTYTGGTGISIGILQIGNGGTTGNIVGDVFNNASLVFDRSNAVALAGKISGHGTVTQAGAGMLTLTGANTYSGGTTVNAGVISFNNSSALGTGGVTLNNGSGLLATTNLTLPNPLTINAGQTGVISAAPNTTLTLNAVNLVGNAVFGRTGGTGIVDFGPSGSGSAVSYNSAIEVAFGTLRNTDNNLGTYLTTAASTTVDAGATLDIDDFSTFIGNLQGSGAVKLGSTVQPNLTILAGNFGGAISGAGQVTKFSAGTLVLSGTNTYTGGTTISDGALQIGNGGTTGSIVGNVMDDASLVFNHSNALTFAGTISGAGSLTQTGAGVLTLTGANTFAGGTRVHNGVIAFNHPGVLGSGDVALENGGGLLATANLALDNSVVINTSETGRLSAAPGTTLTLDAFNLLGNAVFGSPGNTGVVAFGPFGPGFNVNNTCTIEVAAGTLRNTSSAFNFYVSSAASTTVDVGATLDINDSTVFVRNLQGSGTVKLGVSAATNLIVLAGNFGGVISGAGQVTKFSPGMLALTGANTYTGGTTIAAGMLLAGNTSGSATGTGPVTVTSGGRLGGGGTIAGAVKLSIGGMIAPGAGSPGIAGTTLHASSLLWDGGGQLTLQLGVTGDKLALTGALTKGAAGTFTLDLIDAGITQSTYTLATFASTTFAPSDFVLELPANYTGTLVETTTSLILENLVGPQPHGEAPGATSPFPSDANELSVPAIDASAFGLSTLGTDDSATLAITPAPEPASATLLAFGASVLLGWRRRRRR